MCVDVLRLIPPSAPLKVFDEFWAMLNEFDISDRIQIESFDVDHLPAMADFPWD